MSVEVALFCDLTERVRKGPEVKFGSQWIYPSSVRSRDSHMKKKKKTSPRSHWRIGKNPVFFCLSRSWFLSLILLPKQSTSTVLVIKRLMQFIVNRKLFLKMKGELFSELKGCPQSRGRQLFLFWLSSHRDVFCRRGCQSLGWGNFQVQQDTILPHHSLRIRSFLREKNMTDDLHLEAETLPLVWEKHLPDTQTIDGAFNSFSFPFLGGGWWGRGGVRHGFLV